MARVVSARRQIHRYIRTLLQQRPPPPPPMPSATGVTVAVPPSSVVRSDSGSTSSKRRKRSPQDNDCSCRNEMNDNDYVEEEEDAEAFLVRDNVHQHEQGPHELASAVVAVAAPEEVMVLDEDDDWEVEIEGNNVEDSESQSEDEDGDDEEFMEEEDGDEDVGSDSVHEQEESSRELASAVAAAPVAPPGVHLRTRTAVANVTVCDADAMECGVCFLALRPPIFQCELGHVVCSACRDKLESAGNGVCHVCGVATRGGYRRCHAMENLVECIRVPCPYKAHGCEATPPYHGKESHSQVCLHAPCHCPGDSCNFIGSTSALLDHFAGAHDWPCTTKVRAGETFSILLRVGFNFFLLEDHGSSDGEKGAATGSVPCRLFLLNVTQERLGCAISVLCIQPHGSGPTNGAQQLPSTQCELVFSRYGDSSSCRRHYQSSVFYVVSTDLSSGLPNPESCFQFIVPNAVLGDNDKNSIQVKARIIN